MRTTLIASQPASRVLQACVFVVIYSLPLKFVAPPSARPRLASWLRLTSHLAA